MLQLQSKVAKQPDLLSWCMQHDAVTLTYQSNGPISVGALTSGIEAAVAMVTVAQQDEMGASGLTQASGQPSADVSLDSAWADVAAAADAA